MNKIAVIFFLIGPVSAFVFATFTLLILPAIRKRRTARKRVSERFLSAGSRPAV